MLRSREAKAKGFFRQSSSGAFDQYLQDIQKLPLISEEMLSTSIIPAV